MKLANWHEISVRGRGRNRGADLISVVGLRITGVDAYLAQFFKPRRFLFQEQFLSQNKTTTNKQITSYFVKIDRDVPLVVLDFGVVTSIFSKNGSGQNKESHVYKIRTEVSHLKCHFSSNHLLILSTFLFGQLEYANF